MALTNAQRNEIHHRANGTGGYEKETGSALAREFGVSASAISNIKNNWTPTEEEATGSVEETTSNTLEAEETPAAIVPTRTVIVNSSKLINHVMEVPVGATFGVMLDQLGQDRNVEGIFTGSDSKAMEALKKDNDVLPDTGDKPLYIYLSPVKTNAGA